MKRTFLRVCAVLALAVFGDARDEAHVVLVTLDGVRWQEVFRGADEALIDKDHGGVEDVAALRARFWRPTAEERRAALMPFLWSVVAKEGQLLGNADKGSVVRVTNGLNFSYPGYSELLCGFADPRVDSNDPRPNPNVTVLEWLHAKDPWRGRVAVFSSWDCFSAIVNETRSGVLVNAGSEPVDWATNDGSARLLNELMADLQSPWTGVRYDAFTQRAALQYVHRTLPKVLYVAFDETDEFAHEGRYDRLLDAIHRVDGYLATLWRTLRQGRYRGKTTLIVTTDHGRGDAPIEWKNHGKDVAGSDRIWIAAIGPTTRPMGERAEPETLGQDQIAATIASMLGEDYRAAVPRAGAPIDALLR
jgi:hypothetical protein